MPGRLRGTIPAQLLASAAFCPRNGECSASRARAEQTIPTDSVHDRRYDMRSGGWRGAVALVGVLTAVAPAAAQEIKYPVGMLGKYTPDGMLIQKVISGTPADKGGLQSGDLVLKVDGRL